MHSNVQNQTNPRLINPKKKNAITTASHIAADSKDSLTKLIKNIFSFYFYK